MLTRDVNRRIKVIQSKISDLQKMGIPAAFVYVTTWTGALYVSGDERIAEQLKLSSQPILDALQNKREKLGELTRNFCLPRLPGKLDLLNNKTVVSMLVGVGKDLKIQWKGDPPEWWWPDQVPFQHPRDTAPEKFKGYLHVGYSQCLQHNYNFLYRKVD